MARLFTVLGGDFLHVATAIVTAPPFTMAAWVYPTAIAVGSDILQVGTATTANNRFALRISATGQALGLTRDAAVNGLAQTSAVATANNWHHFAFTSSATNSRAAYLDGGSKATNATDLTPVGMDNSRIGANSSGAALLDGRVAEACVWNVALEDGEIAALARRLNPREMRPISIVGYWPLHGYLSPEPDWSGLARNMTLTGGAPARANHAPIMIRSAVSSEVGTAAAEPVYAQTDYRFYNDDGTGLGEPA